MPILLSVSHASPQNVFPQEFLKEAVAQLYAGKIPDEEVRRVRDVFDHSRIRERAFMMPLEWYLSPHGQEDRNRVFRENGLALMERAAGECMEAAGITPGDVDHVVFVCTTGLATPSLDGYLVNRLGLSPSTGRLPVWGLGCAAGAAGISRAFDYCLAHPQARVLLVALETCSLNFRGDDMSKRNLVAMSLFSDGCAALLMAGDDAGHGGPHVIATRSHLFPDSYRVMGWDVDDGGFRLVLSPELPRIVRENLSPLVDEFLLANDLSRADVGFYLAHPGGARVVDAMKEALSLRNGELKITEEVLRDFGNVSSVTVLIVLERWLGNGRGRENGYGLLSAFGPGFSAELVLLRA